MKTESFDPSPLADTLRKAREYRNLTQQELAEKTGMKPAAISHFETAQRTPSIPNIIRLCRALSVSPNRMLAKYLMP